MGGAIRPFPFLPGGRGELWPSDALRACLRPSLRTSWTFGHPLGDRSEKRPFCGLLPRKADAFRSGAGLMAFAVIRTDGVCSRCLDVQTWYHNSHLWHVEVLETTGNRPGVPDAG